MPDDRPISGSYVHRDMVPAAPVADATGGEDVVTQLNALMASLRAAGILLTSDSEDAPSVADATAE